MPVGYLIYHPGRCSSNFKGTIVHFDQPKHNQDPYIWNKQFLHSTCHITQMRTEPGQINFWVSGDSFPYFNRLYCDLIFVVKSKIYWENKDYIDPTDELVDNLHSYNDHYYHIPIDHPYKRRRRYTLKADQELSFQPQDKTGCLIDLLPILNKYGFSTSQLHIDFKSGIGSRPIKLLNDQIVKYIYDDIFKHAEVKLFGKDLEKIRLENSQLASPR
ncbi:hypothetical protein C7J99_00100 [Brevibacillus brevis]|nr:hypothetical protein C7J99_00100 [Brevibacillus brevis]